MYLTVCLSSVSLHPPQTPFTFGLNQRAPYTAGERCLLCRCERKDSVVPSEAGISGQNGTAQPAKTTSALQLPLWVCSDCRRTVEKEDRHTNLEQSLGVSHLGVKRFSCEDWWRLATKCLWLWWKCSVRGPSGSLRNCAVGTVWISARRPHICSFNFHSCR